METGTEKPWEDQKLWLRLLIMIVLGFFYWFCQFIIFAFAIIQLGFLLVSGERCDPIYRISYRLSLYVKQLVDFLLFTSETRPFPFSDFPEHRATETESASSSQAAQADGVAHSATAPEATAGNTHKNAEEPAKSPPRKTARKKKSSGKKRSRKTAESTSTEDAAPPTDTAAPVDKENES